MTVNKAASLGAIAIVTGGLLAGCESIERETGFGEKAQIGAGGGATTGGLIAAATGAGPLWIAASTILGGLTGGAIGDWLDRQDQREYAHSTYDAFETRGPGGEVSWRNPETGAYGTTRITDRYVDDEGRTCKTFTQRISGQDRTETTSGLACQQADGNWAVETVG